MAACLSSRAQHVSHFCALPSESWESCAYREVLEETALELTDIRFVGVVNAVDVATDYHYVVIFMQGRIAEREPPQIVENCEPDKCEGKVDTGKHFEFVFSPFSSVAGFCSFLQSLGGETESGRWGQS